MTQSNNPTNPTNADHREVSDRILARLRGLLSKTVDRGCTEEEASLAAEHVAKLCAEYQIAVSEVPTDDPTHPSNARSRTPAATHQVADMGVSKSIKFDWCLTLGNSVARQTFTKFIWWSDTRRVAFIGSPEDITTAHALYAFLVAQAHRIAHAHWTSLSAQRRAHFRRYGLFRAPFLIGLADRVSARLRDSEARSLQDPNFANAIVPVRDVLTKRNEDYSTETFKTKRVKVDNSATINKHYDAYTAGRRAGDRVDLAPTPASAPITPPTTTPRLTP